MKSLVRNALLGAAGLVALSLPAHAIGSTAVADTPLFKPDAETVKTMQLAQRRELFGPSSGSVGFKRSAQRRELHGPSSGSVGFKKSKKKKAK
jgi:hypothetical protein